MALVCVCVGGGCRKELWMRSGAYFCDGIWGVCLYCLNVEVERLFVVAYGLVVGGSDSNVEVDGLIVVALGVVVSGMDLNPLTVIGLLKRPRKDLSLRIH